MLLWQRKSRAPKNYFFITVVLYVTVFHVAAFALMTVAQHRATEQLVAVQAVPQHVRIVCDPTLFKTSYLQPGTGAGGKKLQRTRLKKQKPLKKASTKKALKKEEPKSKAPQKAAPVPQEVAPKIIPPAPTEVPQKNEEHEELQEAILYVDKTTFEQMKIHKALHDALAHAWHPPRGILADAQCVLEVCVQADGTVKSYTVKKSSGYPIYDMAAKTAALQTQYPQLSWNKTLIITF